MELNPINPYLSISEPFVVVAPTYEIEATESINDFIEHGNNKEYLRGFLGSGNLNFGNLYVFTAKDLAKEYDSPLLYSFEYSGTSQDIDAIKEILREID